MRTICVHTGDFAAEALESFRLYAPDVEYVETKGLYGYNEAVASRWDSSDSLLVIEQDKEITSEVLPSLERCDQPWCVYSYRNFPEPYTRLIEIGLGCTRFSVEAQKAIATEDFIRPDYDFIPTCRLCNGEGCWRNLDMRISIALMNKGFTPHVHGEVKHHHDYPDTDEWLKSLHDQFNFEVSNA